MDKVYYVNCLSLNFRSSPKVSKKNIIKVLHQNDEVTIIGDGEGPYPWIKVVICSGECGYVSVKYLISKKKKVPEHDSLIAPVHLKTNKKISRHNAWGRAYPLDETEILSFSSDHFVNEYGLIAGWLDVENSERYQPKKNVTYCNVYAYDFACQLGVYIPRVWWNDYALVRLSRGHSVDCIYGKTVREMSANRLFDWFKECGGYFGWKRVDDLTKFQLLVNHPTLNPGIICAKHKDSKQSGHITFCLPELSGNGAVWKNGVVKKPLQSQAGAKNKTIFTSDWFTWKRFQDWGMWVNVKN